jgi:hypothetical protein
VTDQREDQQARLSVQVSLGPEAEAEEVAEATLQLRRELLELDVEAVDLARGGEPPPGSRAVEFVALGTLIVSLAKSGVLASAVGAIRSWVEGHPQRTIKLEVDGDVLELTGVSSKEQRRLADAWLRRRTTA